MKDLTICVQNEPLFWLGDHFFKVEEKYKKYENTRTEYRSLCPSCNDTRKITYKGYDGKDYEAECPVCKGSAGNGYGNNISLSNWEVHEYIVYSIDARGPETVSVYKDGKGYIDQISLKAFYKFGRCKDDYITTSIPWNSRNVDIELSTIDIASIKQYSRHNDIVFTSSIDAEKFCEMLKEYDRQRLAEFNKTY